MMMCVCVCVCVCDMCVLRGVLIVMLREGSNVWT
jgi:hypothetical protein